MLSVVLFIVGLAAFAASVLLSAADDCNSDY